jgi:hypothetical protein
MSNGILPPLGRTGLVGGVRRISDMTVTGWRPVDPAANFIQGQLAKLNTVSGQVLVQTVSGTSDKVVGMFFTDNTTVFYRPSFREVHTFGENPSAPNDVYLMPYVKTASYSVQNLAGTPYTETTNFTLNTTNGILTNVNMGATATVYVSYMYKDVNLSGINQTLGSGMAALLEGVGEIGTLAYDTSSATAYALNAAIYFNATGYLTSASGSTAIGYITKAPTADDPELRVKLSLV